MTQKWIPIGFEYFQISKSFGFYSDSFINKLMKSFYLIIFPPSKTYHILNTIEGIFV